MFKKLLLLLLTIILFVSCLKDDNETLQCYYSDLGITEANGTFYGTSFSPHNGLKDWTGRFSEEFVEIYVTLRADHLHPQTKDLGFVFKKTENCPQFYYAYVDTEGYFRTRIGVNDIKVLGVYIQEWIEDKKFVGKIRYENEYGFEKVKNFWVEFTTDNYYNFNYNSQTIENCITNITPVNIDMNNDGIIDFTFQNDVNTIPLGKYSKIKALPKNNNYILVSSYRPASVYYIPLKTIIFETPFTTSGKTESQHLDHPENVLGLLIDYSKPYDRFNYWFSETEVGYYNPNFPDSTFFGNNNDDYILVKLEKDGLYYYGWIKIKVNYANCQFEVLETYLNPNPNEHVSVN